MKKNLFLVLLLFYSFTEYASTCSDTIKYNTNITPYNRKFNYQTWGIKGRPIPYILGNGMGVSTLLGAEFGFLKNNSIGLDGLFNGFHDIDDMPYEQDLYTKELAVHLNFNHYWGLQKLRQKGQVVFYTGITTRKGLYNEREERGRQGDSIINTEKKYFCYGGQIGTIFTLDSRPFAININIPILYNNKTITYTDSKNPRYNNITKLSTVDWRFELNLYWWFLRRDKSIYSIIR